MHKNSLSIMFNFIVVSCIQITLLLSRTLPNLLEDETYLCHLASNRSTFTVEAEGSETTYTCKENFRIPTISHRFVVHASLVHNSVLSYSYNN